MFIDFQEVFSGERFGQWASYFKSFHLAKILKNIRVNDLNSVNGENLRTAENTIS